MAVLAGSDREEGERYGNGKVGKGRGEVRVRGMKVGEI